MDLIIAVEDPNAGDVRALLERHLTFARGQSPPEHVHALAGGAWPDADLTLFGARRDGSLMGVGAIRRLDETHAELKSMHTRAEARGQGVGQAVLAHLLQVAENPRLPAGEPGNRDHGRVRRRPLAVPQGRVQAVRAVRPVHGQPVQHLPDPDPGPGPPDLACVASA